MTEAGSSIHFSCRVFLGDLRMACFSREGADFRFLVGITGVQSVHCA